MVQDQSASGTKVKASLGHVQGSGPACTRYKGKRPVRDMNNSSGPACTRYKGKRPVWDMNNSSVPACTRYKSKGPVCAKYKS
jgi:hypothetical protein